MKLVEIDWHPTNRQLRQFGGLCLFALPGIAWLWGGTTTVIATLAVVGAVLAVVGLVRPQAIRFVFLAFMIVAIPIGMVLGEVAMLCVFFGVFLPIGLAFRLMGRDALQLKMARDTTTYWRSKPKPPHAGSYYRQT